MSFDNDTNKATFWESILWKDFLVMATLWDVTTYFVFEERGFFS